jgi:heat shock protein HslJ
VSTFIPPHPYAQCLEQPLLDQYFIYKKGIKTMKFLIPGLVAILLLLSACGAATPEPTTVPEETIPAETAPEETESNLTGTQWQLISFGAPGAEIPVVAGSTVTLEFNTNGQAGGSGGCNSYGGEYQVQDNVLSFSQIVSTLMACADSNVTQQEQQFFQALESAGRFEHTEDQLTIQYDGGQGVLNFISASR